MKQKLSFRFLNTKTILNSKKGALSTSSINTAIMAIVLLVVLFKMYASLIPEAQTAGDELNDSNQCTSQGFYYNTSSSVCQTASGTITAADLKEIPFSGLFSGSGVVFIVIMAALIIVVVKSFLSGKK